MIWVRRFTFLALAFVAAIGLGSLLVASVTLTPFFAALTASAVPFGASLLVVAAWAGAAFRDDAAGRVLRRLLVR
jgi:hypothetical protein